MKHLLTGVLGLSVLLISCQNTTQSTNSPESDAAIDTIHSVRVGNDQVTPKSTFEFNSFIDFQGDTLGIVTCAEYVYSPFGTMNNKTDLKTGNLRNFVTVDKIEKTDNGELEFQKLTLGLNRIIVFFDHDPESSKSSYVIKGEIFDNRVVFENNIKIGMTKKSFIDQFFDYFPENLINNYQTIVFESCVEAITHTYTFRNDRLESVKFDSDNYWKVDYE
ncbi:MAG: hypothetical protein IPH20_18460 [Bacteroidales bacterium]|nr:hypothetical protein [Bacteroidales bacterium]